MGKTSHCFDLRKPVALAVTLALVVFMLPWPAAAIETAGCGTMGCIGGVDVPQGYSKYIVVFQDSCDPAECAAMIEDNSSTHGYTILYKYSIINGVAVLGPDDNVGIIRAMEDVKYVEKAQPVHTMLDTSIPIIGADQVWSSGYTGSGIKVAVVDTGVDGGHPDLQGKVVAWNDLVQGRSTPYDDHGHGTHCAGIIAGSGAASGGKYKGVAPGAGIIGVKALDGGGTGDTATIIAGVDWAADYGADVISLSLGSYQHVQALDDAVNNAVRAGIVVVAAAGNGGPGAGTISCPGDCRNAITVGAVDKSDNIASFSSRGPNRDNTVKPDVVDIGVGVVAPRASGTSMGSPVNQYYTSASGTSMATPMTAGVVALLLQKSPALTPSQVKSALTGTAKRLGSGVPNNNYGYGRVRAKSAFDYISGATPSPSPSSSPTPTPQPGDYGVTTTHRWAGYGGVNKPIEQFSVTPGTTAAQSVYYKNTGTRPDSYTISVAGIPSSWYTVTVYGASTVSPGDGRYGNVYITPAAGGDYTYTVTVTSNGNPQVSSGQTYTLHTSGTPSPSPSPSPTPTATPTPTPTLTPTPSPSPSPTPGNSMIKGLKYVDQNDDGRYQVTEPRLPGVTIRLYRANGDLLATRVTDHNGYYSFANLAAGTYIVQEVTPVGYMSSSPSRVTVQLGANTIYTLHFGNVPV